MFTYTYICIYNIYNCGTSPENLCDFFLKWKINEKYLVNLNYNNKAITVSFNEGNI